MGELAPDMRSLIEKATVKLPDVGGQAVLVKGGFLLTAAHCLELLTTGGIALGDRSPVLVAPPTGSQFRAAALSVEPLSDIAVLAELDHSDESRASFYEFADNTTAVEISLDEPHFGEWFDVYILSYNGEWLEGRAAIWQPHARCLGICSMNKIESGTSGGPVVDAAGRLVAIMSRTSEHNHGDGFVASGARPSTALPAGILREIECSPERHFDSAILSELLDVQSSDHCRPTDHHGL